MKKKNSLILFIVVIIIYGVFTLFNKPNKSSLDNYVIGIITSDYALDKSKVLYYDEKLNLVSQQTIDVGNLEVFVEQAQYLYMATNTYNTEVNVVKYDIDTQNYTTFYMGLEYHEINSMAIEKDSMYIGAMGFEQSSIIKFNETTKERIAEFNLNEAKVDSLIIYGDVLYALVTMNDNSFERNLYLLDKMNLSIIDKLDISEFGFYFSSSVLIDETIYFVSSQVTGFASYNCLTGEFTNIDLNSDNYFNSVHHLSNSQPNQLLFWEEYSKYFSIYDLETMMVNNLELANDNIMLVSNDYYYGLDETNLYQYNKEDLNLIKSIKIKDVGGYKNLNGGLYEFAGYLPKYLFNK